MTIKNYGMFSDYGNQVAANIVKDVLKTLPITATNQDIYNLLTKFMDEASRDNRTCEIYDTEVREAMISEIEKKTGRSLTIYF